MFGFPDGDVKQEVLDRGVIHKDFQSHVSGCLDSEGVVVVMYRSGGLCFDPKVTLGYPFGRHVFANTVITYISDVFTDVGIGNYTVPYKLSNAAHGGAQREWVVAMFERLDQNTLYSYSSYYTRIHRATTPQAAASWL